MTFFSSRRGAGLLLNPYDKRGSTGMYGDGYAYEVPLYDRDLAVLGTRRYGGAGNFQNIFDTETGTWFKEATKERCFKIKGSTTSIIFRLKVLSKMTWWGKGYMTPDIADPFAGAGRYWGDGADFSPTPPWAYGQGICTTKYSVLNLDHLEYDSSGTPTASVWAVYTKEMDPSSGIVSSTDSFETYPAATTTPPGSSAWYSGFFYRDEGSPISIDQLSVNESLSWDWDDREKCYLVARDKDDPENPAYSISSNFLNAFPFGEIPYADIYLPSFFAYQSDEHGYSYGKVNRQLKIRLEAQLDAVPRDCCWLADLKIKGSIKMKAWTLQTVLGSNPYSPTMIVPTPDADESLDFDETLPEWDGTPYYHGGAKVGEVMLIKEFEVSPDPGIAKAIEDFFIESVGY